MFYCLSNFLCSLRCIRFERCISFSNFLYPIAYRTNKLTSSGCDLLICTATGYTIFHRLICLFCMFSCIFGSFCYPLHCVNNSFCCFLSCIYYCFDYLFRSINDFLADTLDCFRCFFSCTLNPAPQ